MKLRSKRMRLWRWLRYLRRRVQRLRDCPQAIACGLGLGGFSACLPLFGAQTAIAVVLAIIFRGNKVCAAFATWLSNPLTYVPLYWANYNLGLWLCPAISAPDRLRWTSPDEMLVQMRGIAIPLGVGSIVMGCLVGVSVYTVSLAVLIGHRRWRSRRRSWFAPRD